MAKSAAKKTATWVILGLLFVGLIGFGATGLSGNVRTIGTVGEKEITTQEYANRLSQQVRSFEAQMGQALPFSQVEAFGIDQAVVASLVSARALDNEAARLGLSVGDARVAQEIRAMPNFQGIDGTFDREGYAYTLEQNGLSETEFETRLREQLARSLLETSVVGAIPASDAYAQAISDFLGETRSFLWVPLGEDDLAEPLPEPTEDELRAYYDANRDLFMSPETREITYAALTPEMLVDVIELDETMLQDLYDERISDYVRPERRLVERLVFESQEAAEAALARIESGEADFDTVVTDRGLDLADVDMGDVTEDDLGPAGEGVFAASVGDVVGPLESDFGPALFRMNAILPAQETTFEEALPDLREELAAERARRVIQDRAEGINDLLAGGATLENLAEQTDLELDSIEFTEDTDSGIAAYAAFRQAAEAVEEGAYPEIVELEDGGIVLMRLDSVREPAPFPFAEIETRVAETWRRDELSSRLMARAEEMAATIEAEGDFTADMPAPFEELGRDRRAFIPETPPAFLTEVFEMEEGAARAIETPAGAIVVQLTTITPVAEGEATDEARQLAEQARSAISSEIFTAYRDSVQARTEVRVDQSAVQAVNATFR